MKQKSNHLSFLVVLGSSFLTIIPYSNAAMLYWDGATPAGAPGGGAGNWQTAGAWDSTASADSSSNWADGSTAIFGGTAGTVTIGAGGVTAGGLQFNTTNYNITTGANALSFTGNSTVGLYNIAAATITGNIGSTAANLSFTAQNPFTAATVTFTGANSTGWSGTTTINAGMLLATTTTSGNINQVLNSTSDIMLYGGSVQFNRATNAQLEAISNTAPITVSGGGTFGVTSADGGGPDANETIGPVTVSSGQMNFNWTNNPSSGATIVMSSFTRSDTTSALTISQGADGRFRNSAVSTDTAANEIIGPWATIGAANGIAAQTDYAIYGNGNGTLLARGIAVSNQSDWSTDYTPATGTLNNTIGAAGAPGQTLSASRKINSLRHGAAGSATANSTTEYFTLAGNTFIDGDVVGASGTGGLTAGTPYYVINSGGAGAGTFQLSTSLGGAAVNLASNTAGQIAGVFSLADKNLGTCGILNGTAAPLIINHAGGAITLPTTAAGSLFVTAGAGLITINVPIQNNTGILTLVKSGANALTLSDNNTYTGGTVVNAGSVTVSGSNTFATGSGSADVINGGSLTYSTLASWGGTGRSVTFNGTGTLTSTVAGYAGGTLTSNAGANAFITGSGSAAGSQHLSFATTTGSGNIIYSAAANQNRYLNLGNASGFTGTLQARLTGNANFGTSPSIQFSSIDDAPGSALQFAAGVTDSNNALMFAYNGTSALTFNNRQIQIMDRLASTNIARDNIIANNSSDPAHTWTITPALSYNDRGQTFRYFVLSGSNGGNNAFNGLISNGSSTSNDGLHVSKAGTGKWILGGANTYTGGTTVAGGTLQVTDLADGGTSSNIGAASSSPNGLRLAGGTLRYTGSGDTINRNFALTGSSTLDASGTGPLIFSQTAAISPDYTTTATWSNYSATVPSTTNLAIGMTVSGGFGATINAIINETTVGLSGTATGSGTLNFGYGTAARTLTLAGTNTDANTIAGQLQSSTANSTGSALAVAKSDAGRWVLSGTNSYTGTTTINAGVLEATDGAGLPTNSILQLRGGVFQSSGNFSRPVSTVAGAVNWSTGSGGFAARGAPLILNLNGGNSSITWNASSMVQTGQTLVLGSSSADDLVDFQNDLNLGSSNSGQRTIQVDDNTASSTDIARISGDISNTALGWGINKTGTGTLELTGSNSYTGLTTVSQGTLALVGGNQASAITVAPGASLGFTLGSPTTSTSTVDLTNGTVKITGTTGAPSYLLMTASSISGAPTLATAIPGYQLVKANEDKELRLEQISDVTPPTLASSDIVDDKTGGPVTMDTSLTYTVTFSEDMDADTVSAADFGNAGTAAVTIGLVTETTPGVFTVPVTPTSAGTLTLRVNAAAVLTDTSGNPLDTTSAIADNTTITVQSQYDAWASGALFDSDPNGDGLKSGLAWILGASGPNESALDKLPTVSASGGNMILSFKRIQASINANTALTIEVGTTLIAWPTAYTVGADTAGSSAGVEVIKDSPNEGTDTVTLTLPQSLDANKFARLKAVRTP